MIDVLIDYLKLNGKYKIIYLRCISILFIYIFFFHSGLGCSLKRYCTNKQFQNKQFKKTSIIKTEYKGYGICADENIPKYVNTFNLISFVTFCILFLLIFNYLYIEVF